MLYESLYCVRFLPSAALVKPYSKLHKSALASGINSLALTACSLCRLALAAPEGSRGTGLSPLGPQRKLRQRARPSLQRPFAASCGSERKQSRCSERSSNAQRQQGSCKVQNPRRNKSKKKLGLYHVSRRACVARPASLPEREQRLVLLRPGPFPHAGRWESLATRRSYRGEPRTACAPASRKSQSRAE